MKINWTMAIGGLVVGVLVLSYMGIVGFLTDDEKKARDAKKNGAATPPATP